MEFKINQKEILLCFQRVQGFINLKGANPVLSNVRIEAKGSGIEVFATDYDVGLSGSYEATVVEEGVVALHGKMLFDIVRQLPEDEIMFRYSGTGRCEVACGKSNFKLATIDSEEYPENPGYPDEKLITVDKSIFKNMLDKTIYAASQNESRMALNGIYCQFYPNAFKVVATDGHRLAYVSRSVDFPVTETVSVIIPRRAVIELKKLIDEDGDGETLGIVRADNRIFVKIGSLLFFSREVEGSYPNYDQVIPYKNSKEAVIDVESVKMALRRVSTVAAEKSKLISFNFKPDKLEISSESSEIGEAFEEVEIEYSGDVTKIGLNSQYTLETLSHINSGKAVLKFEGQEDALMVKPSDDDDCVSVIMPMRI